MVDFLNKEEGLKKVKELVEDYHDHKEKYDNLNERRLRNRFIDPFFGALGWNMDNTGCGPDNMAVLQEQRYKDDEGNYYEPDYTFCLTGTPKFLVEAKKASDKLDENGEPANQIRDYGAKKNLPLSILTNFKEFAIYDTRPENKPNKDNDPNFDPNKVDPKECRLDYFEYKDYIENWDELYKYFSNSGVVSQKIDNYLKDHEKKYKKSIPIDEDFLNDIKERSLILAENININNNINRVELNYAVQQIIYRILFFRILEDRCIEKERSLEKLITDKDNTSLYSKFIKKCEKAYNLYNNDLFNFYQNTNDSDVDMITKSLKIDDKIIKEFIENLYYPSCQYDFSDLDIEIFSKVFDKFLNEDLQIIHDDKVSYKKNFKNPKGNYFISQNVSKDIVQKTVKKLVGKKTPEEISKIKILDPACGFGTLLLEAYDFLLDYHLDYYKKFDKSNERVLFKHKGKHYLTITEKARILKNNIFGVEDDLRASEVTKLNLLLKLYENPMKDEKDVRELFNHVDLPSLKKNIKYGNILLDLDVFGYIENSSCDLIQPFNYNDEFKKILNRENKGFDIIISNLAHKKSKSYLNKYLKNKYNFYDDDADISVCFYEIALNILKKGGLLGYVTPINFAQEKYGTNIREELSNNTYIYEFDVRGVNAFKNKKNSCIIILKKSPERNEKIICNNLKNKTFFCDQNILGKKPWVIKISNINLIKNKIKQKGTLLKEIDVLSNHIGLITGKNDIFKIDVNKKEELIDENQNSKKLIKPLFEIDNYFNKNSAHENYLINTKRDINVEKGYPAIYKYLCKYKTDLEGRKSEWIGVCWYNLQSYPYEILDKPKIIYPGLMKDFLNFFDVEGKYHILGSAYCIYHENNDIFYLKILNSILSSKLMKFYIKSIAKKEKDGNRLYYNSQINNLPVIEINKDNPTIFQLNELINNVNKENEELKNLKKDCKNIKLPDKKKNITNHILYLKNKKIESNKNIDDLIYELYDITEEEKEIIEYELDNSNKPKSCIMVI